MGRGRHAGFQHSKETRQKIGQVMRARAAVRKVAKMLELPAAAAEAEVNRLVPSVRCQKQRENGNSKNIQSSVAK